MLSDSLIFSRSRNFAAAALAALSICASSCRQPIYLLPTKHTHTSTVWGGGGVQAYAPAQESWGGYVRPEHDETTAFSAASE